MIKPFDFGGLKARIRNLLRREFVQAPQDLRLNGQRVDTEAKRVSFDGRKIPLTRKE